MIDWDAIIAAAINEGVSKEDLAKQMTDALNKSEPVKKKLTAREEMIKKMADAIDKHMKSDSLNLSDATAIAWLCAVQDTDVGKAMTTPKELSEFFDFISDDLGATIEKWQAYKALDGIFKFSERKCECHSKREGNEGGTGRIIKTDGETVANFLRSMGLLR